MTNVPNMLPSGIWTRCFIYLPTRDDVRAVTLTCRQFRDVGQAALFEHVTYTGVPFDVNPSRKQLSKLGFHALRARLVALRGSPVRGYIHHVSLVDWVAGHPEPVVWELGENLFETLAALPNLESASCERLLMKTEHFQKLASHTGLRNIALRDCTFSFDDQLPYQLEEVALMESRDMPKVTGFAGSSYAYAATTILRPEHLRKVELDMPMTIAQLLPQLVEMPPFGLLTSLTLCTPAQGESSALVQFLNRCPALEHLAVIDFGALNAPLAGLDPSALPVLKSYSGSLRTFAHIVPLRPIERWTLRAADIDIGEDHYTTTEHVHTPEEVRVAAAMFDETTSARVKEIGLYVHSWDDHDLTATLAAKFPRASIITYTASHGRQIRRDPA